MVEHDGFLTVLSGKISSDKIINNNMRVMNTFWTRNARNLPQEKLTNWQKQTCPPPPPCLMLLSLLLFGSVLSFSRSWGKSSAITDQDLYSLGCSTVGYKGVKTCFLLVLFCTEWRDAFFVCYHDSSIQSQISDPVVLKYSGVFDLQYVQPSSQLILCGGCFFLLITTGLNQRGALKAPPFSYIRNGEEKRLISQCLSWNIDAVISFPILRYNSKRKQSLSNTVWCFVFLYRETLPADCRVTI